ncbi:gp58-like family protein [Brochothrix thermosphacta]|uniref:gp58-like family protein n=1 Tax=Brochothrix thermosphacta TaxID=2756 RepID=UPI0039B08AFC
MLNVSDAFQNAFKADLREIKMRITINKKVYTQDDLNSFSYEGGSIAGESFMIGSVFSNSIKITLDKVVEGLKELDEINPEIGIKLPNGTIEYVSMGIFIINSRVDPDRNENKTTIEAADKFIMMGGVYVSKLKYPAEIKAVALEIANLSGIKVNTTTFSRLSASKITKMEGYTYRQAIGLIAQFESGYALFDRAGLLDIRNMFDAAANTEYVITPDTYFQKGLVKNEMLYRLGGISCKVPGNDDTEEKVLRAGSETGAQIELENKVMTQTLLNTIYEKIKNINYFPYTLKWRGNPALEAGDWIRMSDVKGNTFKVPNLDYKLEYTGGLSADSSAETTTQSDASYSYKGPLAQKIEDLTNRVDAAGGNIINEGLDEPKNPKEGDLWFKPNGPDTEIWVYQRIGDTDKFEWVFRVTTAEDPFIKETIEQAQQDIIKAKEEAAKAQQKADEAQQKADESIKKAQEGFDKAQSAIDDLANLEIGSNNLLPNSSFKYGFDNWEGVKTSPYFIRDAEADYPSAAVLEIVKTADGTTQKASTSFQVKNNNTYIISFDVKITGTMPTTNISLFAIRGFKGKNTSNSAANATKNVYVGKNDVSNLKLDYWHRVSIKFDTNADYLRIIPYNSDTTNTLNTQYRRIQVEEGNIATDWTESSSDVDKAVLLVDNKTGAIAGRVTDAEGNITSLAATAQGLQTEVKNKAEQSTVTQLADVVASKVSNTDFESNKTQTAELISSTVSLQNNENIRYLRFSGSGNSVKESTHVLEIEANDSDNKNIALGILPVAEKGSWKNLEYVTDGVSNENDKYADGKSSDKNVSFVIDLKKIYQTLNSLQLWMYVATERVYYNVKLEVSTDKKTWKTVYFKDNYTPTKKGDTVILSNAEASSQISQLSDNINLKVDKNGIINQINISTEGIVIAGENVWISGKTKIDNAVIKNSMIDSLSANKLTAGTIDAGKINVINLNASNISAGIITGANLAINLNSGEVTFQKGIIKRADELFSIDVTKGIVESYDSNGGFTISKGEITLNSSPELTIGNSKKYGTITYKWRLLDASGLALIGEDGYSLGTSNAVKNIANSTVNQGSAISGNKEGYLNVFSRQVINLSSGDLYSYGSLNSKSLASIEIGNTSRNKSEVAISANIIRLSATSGDHILLSSDSTGALVKSMVIYNRTYATAANVYITQYGNMGRSTSASKYKLAIEEDKTDNYKNILKLKHKTWYDKANTEAYARALDDKDTFDWDNPADEVLPVERIHGLIAEDLVEAGLTEFVSYGELNDDGTKEVEGIQYDRLVVPLLQIVKDHQIEIEKLKERII